MYHLLDSNELGNSTYIPSNLFSFYFVYLKSIPNPSLGNWYKNIHLMFRKNVYAWCNVCVQLII